MAERYKDLERRTLIPEGSKVTPVNQIASGAGAALWKQVAQSGKELFEYTAAWAREDAINQGISDAQGHNFEKGDHGLSLMPIPPDAAGRYYLNAWEKVIAAQYKDTVNAEMKENLNKIYAEEFLNPKEMEIKLRTSQNEMLKNVEPAHKQDLINYSHGVINEFMKRSIVEKTRRQFRAQVEGLQAEQEDIMEEMMSPTVASFELDELWKRRENNLNKRKELNLVSPEIEAHELRVSEMLLNLDVIVKTLDVRNPSGDFIGDPENFFIVAEQLEGRYEKDLTLGSASAIDIKEEKYDHITNERLTKVYTITGDPKDGIVFNNKTLSELIPDPSMRAKLAAKLHHWYSEYKRTSNISKEEMEKNKYIERFKNNLITGDNYPDGQQYMDKGDFQMLDHMFAGNWGVIDKVTNSDNSLETISKLAVFINQGQHLPTSLITKFKNINFGDAESLAYFYLPVYKMLKGDASYLGELEKFLNDQGANIDLAVTKNYARNYVAQMDSNLRGRLDHLLDIVNWNEPDTKKLLLSIETNLEDLRRTEHSETIFETIKLSNSKINKTWKLEDYVKNKVSKEMDDDKHFKGVAEVWRMVAARAHGYLGGYKIASQDRLDNFIKEQVTVWKETRTKKTLIVDRDTVPSRNEIEGKYYDGVDANIVRHLNTFVKSEENEAMYYITNNLGRFRGNGEDGVLHYTFMSELFEREGNDQGYVFAKGDEILVDTKETRSLDELSKGKFFVWNGNSITTSLMVDPLGAMSGEKVVMITDKDRKWFSYQGRAMIPNETYKFVRYRGGLAVLLIDDAGEIGETGKLHISGLLEDDLGKPIVIYPEGNIASIRGQTEDYLKIKATQDKIEQNNRLLSDWAYRSERYLKPQEQEKVDKVMEENAELEDILEKHMDHYNPMINPRVINPTAIQNAIEFVTDLIPGENIKTAMQEIIYVESKWGKDTQTFKIHNNPNHTGDEGVFQINIENGFLVDVKDKIKKRHSTNFMANVKTLEDGINEKYPEFFKDYPNERFSFKHMPNKDLQRTVLAAAVVRLKMTLDPNTMPDTVEGRAKWWKPNYNSWSIYAKGTIQGYINEANTFHQNIFKILPVTKDITTHPTKKIVHGTSRGRIRKSFTTEILKKLKDNNR